MTIYKEHNVTRGDAWKPGVLTIDAEDADGNVVDVPVASFSLLECLVWKSRPVAQPDGVDEDLVARITLTPSPVGSITVVASNQVQLLINGSVTALWSQSEYFYAVRGVLTNDGQPRTLVKGSLLVGWGKGTTP